MPERAAHEAIEPTIGETSAFIQVIRETSNRHLARAFQLSSANKASAIIKEEVFWRKGKRKEEYFGIKKPD